MKNMKNSQSGFTLIELVMVIVILGILSAFALPRFADLTGDARTSSIEGLAGALKSGAAIAHSRQLANNGNLGDSVSLEGQTITMVNGYPTANAAGVSAAVAVDANDYTGDTGAATGGATITYTLTGYTPPTGTECQVEYTSANAATDDTAPLTAPYSVAVSTAGC